MLEAVLSGTGKEICWHYFCHEIAQTVNAILNKEKHIISFFNQKYFISLRKF